MHKFRLSIKIYLNALAYLCLVVLCAAVFDFKFDLVGITFSVLALQLVALVSIYSSQRLSLALVYFVYSFIFFCLLPWLHYSSGILIWRSSFLQENTYLEVNSLIFLTNILVFAVNLINVKYKPLSAFAENAQIHASLSIYLAVIFLSVGGFWVTLFLNDFSVFNLFFRGLADEARGNSLESSALQLVLGMGSRMLTLFAFFYSYTKFKEANLLKAALLILLILTIFPTGVPRYMVGMAYIPLMLLFFPRFRDGWVFSSLLIFSIILVFPFLDQFRNFSGVRDLKAFPSVDYFYAAHFDAYENISTAIEVGFTTYGLQLLGVLLFYVPRAFWESKPVGSGSQMADNIGYVFNNISMPFLGEGYINFGISGSVLFAVLLAYGVRKVDGYYKVRISGKGNVDFSTAFYFYLIGSLFFLLRGDLLSSFAYITSGVFARFVISIIMRKFENKCMPR